MIIETNLVLNFVFMPNSRVLDNREYFDDNFSYFSLKPYVVTSHLNHRIVMVQMRGHNICFYAELTKIIPNYQHILPLI